MTRPYTNSVIEFNPNDLNYIAWTQIRLITTRFFPLKHSYTFKRRHIWIFTSERASWIASWNIKFDRVEVTSSLYILTKFSCAMERKLILKTNTKPSEGLVLINILCYFLGPVPTNYYCNGSEELFHICRSDEYADTSEKQKERNENISLEKMHWKVKQMILVAIYRESIAQLVSSVCKLSAPAMHLLLKTSQRYLQMEKSLIFFKQVQQKLKHGNKNLGFQLKWRWNLWGVLF